MTTPSNVLLLYAARGVRGFGDGFAIIILPAYLTAIGYDPVQIGIVATASLLGTALLTLATGTVAARYDLRTLLLTGACLMAGTGLVFPNVEQFAFVALVAFVGTINPATGDLGILVPIEHSMLAHDVPDDERTRTFARYSLIGALSMAAGALAAAVPDFLVLTGIGNVGAFKLMFYAYAALGVLSAVLYRRLPHAHMDQPRASAPLGVARRGLQACRAVQSRCVRRWICCPVVAGVVVVRTLRLISVRCELILFLVERRERVFLSGGGVACGACRSH
jgi:MFS family permease